MIRKILTVTVLLICSYSFAQEGSVSPYSYYGTGDQRFKGTVENRSMGGISVYSDSIHLNLNNPASLGKLRLTTFSVGGNYSSVNLKTADQKETASDFTFDYIALGIPLGNNLGMSFGLRPYTSVGYRIESLDELSNPTEYNRFEGEGGINKVHFALGYEFLKNFSIGALANFNFGTITNKTVSYLDQIQYGSMVENSSEYSGFDFKFSLHYEAEIRENLNLQSSIVYTPANKITSSNSRTISTVSRNSAGNETPGFIQEIDLRTNGLHSTYLHLPESYSFGLGIGKKYTWFLGAEYEINKTSEFKNDFISTPNGAYEDGERFSAGAFWVPDYDSFTSYWKRVTYRVGVHNSRTGLVVNNVPVHDFGMSFGLGLPVRNFSNLNVGIEYGKRGSDYLGRIEENYLNVFISLSLNDKWFQKSLIR
jgi:long-subunit fatty acid transport protein